MAKSVVIKIAYFMAVLLAIVMIINIIKCFVSDGEPQEEKIDVIAALSGDATAEEIEFLKELKFRGKRPTALYYYRELQSLRDPLHFPDSAQPAESD